MNGIVTVIVRPNCCADLGSEASESRESGKHLFASGGYSLRARGVLTRGDSEWRGPIAEHVVKRCRQFVVGSSMAGRAEFGQGFDGWLS